mgnify:CR=1 FL=1
MAAFSLLQWLLLLLVRDNDHTGRDCSRAHKANQVAYHFDVDTIGQVSGGIQNIAGTVINTGQADGLDRIDSACDV